MSLASRVKTIKEQQRTSRERPTSRQSWPAVLARLQQAGVTLDPDLHWWEVIDYLTETAKKKAPDTTPGAEQHGEQRNDCTPRTGL